MATLDAIVKLGVDNPINGMKYPLGHAVRKGMEFQDEARKVANDWRLCSSSIREDVSLTDEGKRRARLRVGKETLEKLAPITKTLEYIRRERDSIASKITAGDSKPPTIEDLYREREYRDRLYGMDESERQRVFLQAVEQNDPLTLRAFFNAPSFARLINDRVEAEGKRIIAERRNPEAAAELADLEFAHAALTENYNDIVAGVKGEAGMEEKWRDPRLDDSAA